MDAESYAVLQRAAADEVGLPAQFAHRVNGQSIAELRKDARQLALDLGYAEPPARDERGRFHRPNQRVNDSIRRAAGYPTSTDEPEQPAIGSVGIGRGGGASPRRVSAPDMNSLIRGAAGARSVVAGDIAEQLAFERARDA
jgi:hypothetical protein